MAKLAPSVPVYEVAAAAMCWIPITGVAVPEITPCMFTTAVVMFAQVKVQIGVAVPLRGKGSPPMLTAPASPPLLLNVIPNQIVTSFPTFK